MESEPPRCPCGFWGSEQTMGFCSKCYKEHQQKSGGIEPTKNEPTLTKEQVAVALSQVKTVTEVSASTQINSSSQDSGIGSSASLDSASSCATAKDATEKSAPNVEVKKDGIEKKEPDETDSKSSSVKREADDSPSKPAQKNKKRCYACHSKLELAQREIGKCKCEYVFCNLHRLPEEHNCSYDHKETGRREAREKIVKPTRHLGTSFNRMDSQ